jgi:heme-degrading monooxygenase HmoA
MSPILVTITVDDFDHFRSVFETRGLELRRRHGSRGVQVMRHADDPERVALLFDWDADAFRGFLADPEVRASMQAGGTLGPPAITYLEAPSELPA